MAARATLDAPGPRAADLRGHQRAAHRMAARPRRGANRDGRRRNHDRRLVSHRQPRRFVRPAVRRLRSARRRHRRLDAAAVRAGDRQLVRRAPRTRDGPRVRRHFARRRCDDAGRQLRDRARRMARRLRRARDPDVRRRHSVGDHCRADAPAAGRGRQRRAGQRRIAGLRAARGLPLPFILDDLRRTIFLRRRRGRHRVASDHLSHRSRLHRLVRGRHDEPGRTCSQPSASSGWASSPIA